MTSLLPSHQSLSRFRCNVSDDGGEWLRNGGEFSHLEMMPEEMWDRLEKMRGK